MKSIDVTRRGFLAGALATAITPSLTSLRITAPIPTPEQATSAYEWLSVHMAECNYDGGGYLSSAISDTLKTISAHLDHEGLHNPLKPLLAQAERLCMIDPSAGPGLPKTDYGWGSQTEEARIVRAIQNAVNETKDTLNQMSGVDRIWMEKKQAFDAQRAATAPAPSGHDAIVLNMGSPRIDFEKALRIVENIDSTLTPLPGTYKTPSMIVIDNQKRTEETPILLAAPTTPAP